MPILNTEGLLRVAERFGAKVPAQLEAAGLPRRVVRQSAAGGNSRKEYLATTLARSQATAAIAEAEAAGSPGDAATTLAELSQERIIGQSDLLDMNYLELAIAVARGVARIPLPDGAGTGVLVGPGILMTNHHVIPDQETASRAAAQFDYQENTAHEMLPVQVFAFDSRVFITSRDLDFTLVAVAERSSSGRSIGEYPWTKLLPTIGKIEKGEAINIVQHALGGLKQIAFRNNEVIELPSGKPDFLYYTTDTQPGSSGSPCFNDQWELVALHHSGVPRTNGKVILRKDGSPYREGTDSPDTIDWIANEGARTSAIIEALGSLALDTQAAAARDRLLSDAPPNPVSLARASGSSRKPRLKSVTTAREGLVTMEKTRGVSVHVVVSGDEIRSVLIEKRAGDPPPVAAPVILPARSVSPSVGEITVETTAIDPNWKSREGYQSDFLDTEVPLPGLSESQKAQTVEVPPDYRRRPEERFLLNYHHYSLVFNAKRRLAWFSAANVDGDRRFQMKRGKDKWYIDPRIDDPSNPKFQMGEELYAEAGTDRGHLTRYLDVAWGDTPDEAIAATNDTFHFSNCSLQLSQFNQGKDRWQGLEQFLLENKVRKEKRRMVVFTGPVFQPNDPVYRNSRMSYSVRLPLSFWKVCVLRRQDDSLAATAFVLGQPDAADLPDVQQEKFDVGAAQVTIAHLEEITGLDFGLLENNDHFATSGESGNLEVIRKGEKRLVRPLASLDDVVI